MNKITYWKNEIENLYVGWIYNPIIDLWNDFADAHNARFDARYSPKNEDEEGITATVNGKTYRIREHWFAEDFSKVLRKVIKNPKTPSKTKTPKNRRSKR